MGILLALMTSLRRRPLIPDRPSPGRHSGTPLSMDVRHLDSWGLPAQYRITVDGDAIADTHGVELRRIFWTATIYIDGRWPHRLDAYRCGA